MVNNNLGVREENGLSDPLSAKKNILLTSPVDGSD
jgi:hypothetical protein